MAAPVAVVDELVTFPEAVDRRLVEVRRELVGEVQHWLREYEQLRQPEDRGRLLQALDDLALAVRAEC
jgi:hypothetical protein